jgi:UDP-N-acetylglucosamine--N-acetylmuramyl-(pentapeptide) pyrophosphoryl-undecaprenol N-acetylglucosamine transferase
MKVLLSGGGTMGSVSPLVAIYEELKTRDQNLEVLWLGTKDGPEKEFIANYQISFKAIKGGKVRRYFSFWNILTPLEVLIGFFQAKKALKKFKPDVVLTAGSFVAVPVAYAARLLKIPVFIHQQDLEIGRANKLMARVATVITVSFKELLTFFEVKKAYHIDNPVRQEILNGSKARAIQFFKFDPAKKTILILGGGTGAQIINEAVLETLGKLTIDYQLIHLCGQNKKISGQLPDYYDRQTLKIIENNYREYEFLNQEIADAYALADLAVSRAGFSVLTELAVLGKPALVIPIPGHQEINAQFFAKFNAIKILKQENLTKDSFLQAISNLMSNPAELLTLSRNISQIIDKEAVKKYVDLIYAVIGK